MMIHFFLSDLSKYEEYNVKVDYYYYKEGTLVRLIIELKMLACNLKDYINTTTPLLEQIDWSQQRFSMPCSLSKQR